MPAGNFDDKLTLLKSGRKIKAEGPIDTTKHDVVEMCVWVVQRAPLGGDVVANSMGEPDPNGPAPGDVMPSMSTMTADDHDGDMGKPLVGKDRWLFELPLEHAENGVTFVRGPAQAMAIVVIREKGTGKTPGDQGVLLWSQSVVLDEDVRPAAM
jgi:hypothetical protein